MGMYTVQYVYITESARVGRSDNRTARRANGRRARVPPPGSTRVEPDVDANRWIRPRGARVRRSRRPRVADGVNVERRGKGVDRGNGAELDAREASGRRAGRRTARWRVREDGVVRAGRVRDDMAGRGVGEGWADVARVRVHARDGAERRRGWTRTGAERRCERVESDARTDV